MPQEDVLFIGQTTPRIIVAVIVTMGSTRDEGLGRLSKGTPTILTTTRGLIARETPVAPPKQVKPEVHTSRKRPRPDVCGRP